MAKKHKDNFKSIDPQDPSGPIVTRERRLDNRRIRRVKVNHADLVFTEYRSKAGHGPTGAGKAKK